MAKALQTKKGAQTGKAKASAKKPVDKCPLNKKDVSKIPQMSLDEKIAKIKDEET